MIVLNYRFISGQVQDIGKNLLEDGASVVIPKSETLTCEVYHYLGTTVMTVNSEENEPYLQIHASEKISVAHAKSKIEELCDVKLEVVRK